MLPPLQDAADEACSAVPDVEWSVCVRDAAVLASRSPDRVLSTASVGKLLLLTALAAAYEAGDVSPDELLARDAALDPGDSGLWQHLRVERLAVDDLAVLVGSVSDNLATNVLLSRVGLDRVTAAGRALGLERTALHDRVRVSRGPADPARLSSGSADELASLCWQLGTGSLVSPAASSTVSRWLSAGCDLSMVAGGFGLDPLAHVDADRGVQLWHKTGTDERVRADVGFVRGPSASVAYAVLAQWGVVDRRDAVLGAMRRIGEAISTHVSRGAGGSVDSESL